MIIASAVQFTKDNESFIIMGKRHDNCFRTAFSCGLRRPWTEEQGFVTDKFEFLTREEAMNHARNAGQVDKNLTGRLFSEDLW
jgi:hypothetical protein